MTLIAAIRCEGAVLIGADSMSTESATGGAQSFETVKIHKLGERIVWGGSGSGAVGQRTEAAFAEDLKSSAGAYLKDARNVHERCRSVVTRVIKKELEALTISVEVAIRFGVSPINNSLLFVGFHDNAPWICEMTWQGEWTSYPRGFHAIGSGASAAYATYAVLEHHGVENIPVSIARTLLYRILDVCIRSSASGLGPPIRMCEVTSSGARELSDAELDAERDAVELWEQRERECLQPF